MDAVHQLGLVQGRFELIQGLETSNMTNELAPILHSNDSYRFLFRGEGFGLCGVLVLGLQLSDLPFYYRVLQLVLDNLGLRAKPNSS